MAMEPDGGPPLALNDLNWPCDGCQTLKQGLVRLQEEHALNYTALKQKIISTDLLIKKFKSKCDKYDVQTKKLEDTTKKLEKSQRDCQTLDTQMKLALQQVEPLKKANATLAKEKCRQAQEISSLQDKLRAAEKLQNQYELMNRESVHYKQIAEEHKDTNAKNVRSLKKLEGVVAKLKEENNQRRTEMTEVKKKNRKLESNLTKCLGKCELYRNILREKCCLPKSDRCHVSETVNLDQSKSSSRLQGVEAVEALSEYDEDGMEREDSEQEEEGGMGCEGHSFLPQLSYTDVAQTRANGNDACELELADIFSDMISGAILSSPVSPLTPSTVYNDNESSRSSDSDGDGEEEELSKFADLLETEILQPVQEEVEVTNNDNNDPDTGAEAKVIKTESLKTENLKLHSSSPVKARLSSLLEDEVIVKIPKSPVVLFSRTPVNLSDSEGDGDIEGQPSKVKRQSTTEFTVSKDMELESMRGNSIDLDTNVFECTPSGHSVEDHKATDLQVSDEDKHVASLVDTAVPSGQIDDRQKVPEQSHCSKDDKECNTIFNSEQPGLSLIVINNSSLSSKVTAPSCNWKDGSGQVPEEGKKAVKSPKERTLASPKARRRTRCSSDPTGTTVQLYSNNSHDKSLERPPFNVKPDGTDPLKTGPTGTETSGCRIVDHRSESSEESTAVKNSFRSPPRRRRTRSSSSPHTGSSSKTLQDRDKQNTRRSMRTLRRSPRLSCQAVISDQQSERNDRTSPRASLLRSDLLSNSEVGHFSTGKSPDQPAPSLLSVPRRVTRALSRQLSEGWLDQSDHSLHTESEGSQMSLSAVENNDGMGEVRKDNTDVSATSEGLTRTTYTTISVHSDINVEFETAMDETENSKDAHENRISDLHASSRNNISDHVNGHLSPLETTADDNFSADKIVVNPGDASNSRDSPIKYGSYSAQNHTQMSGEPSVVQVPCSVNMIRESSIADGDCLKIHTDDLRKEKQTKGSDQHYDNEKKITDCEDSMDLPKLDTLECDVESINLDGATAAGGTSTVIEDRDSEEAENVALVTSLVDPYHDDNTFSDNYLTFAEPGGELEGAEGQAETQQVLITSQITSPGLIPSETVLKDKNKKEKELLSSGFSTDQLPKSDSNGNIIHEEDIKLSEIPAKYTYSKRESNKKEQSTNNSSILNDDQDNSNICEAPIEENGSTESRIGQISQQPSEDSALEIKSSKEKTESVPVTMNTLCENAIGNLESIAPNHNSLFKEASDTASQNQPLTTSAASLSRTDHKATLTTMPVSGKTLIKTRASASAADASFVPIYIPTTSSQSFSALSSVIRQSTSSITVVSPETSGANVGGSVSSAASVSRSVTPVSRSSSSVSASSPVSPLPPSPFEYLHIIPISPLPPSPAPVEPLSPLPSSPTGEGESPFSPDTTPTEDHSNVDHPGEQSHTRHHIASAQQQNSSFHQTPMPPAITPLPQTPADQLSGVTPTQHTPTPTTSTPQTFTAHVPEGAVEVPARTCRKHNPATAVSRRNLERSFSHDSSQEAEDANERSEQPAVQVEIAPSKPTRRRISHITGSKLGSGDSLKTADKLNQMCDGKMEDDSNLNTRGKKRKSCDNANQRGFHRQRSSEASTPPLIEGMHMDCKPGSEGRVRHSSAGEDFATPVNGKLLNTLTKCSSGGKKRKSSGGEGDAHDRSQKIMVLSSPSTVTTEPKSYPSSLVKLISEEFETYLKVPNDDANRVLEKILHDQPYQLVIEVLVREILKAGASCSINQMLSLLPGSMEEMRTSTGPHLSPQELRITHLLHSLTLKLHGHSTFDVNRILMTSLWREIFNNGSAGLSADIVTRLKTALSRIFVALCRLQGDVEQCRVFVYHVIRSQSASFPVICLAVASVWPDALKKTDSPSPILEVIEFLVLQALGLEKKMHVKMLTSLTMLCHWTKPQCSSSVAVLAMLHTRLDDFIHRSEVVSSNSVYELVKSYELLLLHEDWSSIADTINRMFPSIGTVINQQRQALIMVLIPPLLQLVGIVTSRCPLKQKADVRHFMRKIIQYTLAVKLDNKVPMAIQEEGIQLLLTLSPYDPQDVTDRLKIWYPKHTSKLSPELRTKLIDFVEFYQQRCPQLVQLF